MFSTRAFIKKNKVGNYLKNIREHYIRDDIFCGLESCKSCEVLDTSLTGGFNNKNNLFKFNHYIILDTNIILDQIDILEEDVFGNVIILHTVLKEVKHRSLPVYKRLMSIIENPTRHFYIFTNDHHKDTYINQEKGELINDFNDRCIRKACTWYMKHMPNEKFVLITDDRGNRNTARNEKIKTCTITDYVKNLENSKHLQDKLARKDFHTVVDSDDFYPPHLPTVDIIQGIKDGSLHQGTFRASTSNFLEASVNVDEFEEPVIVQGRAGLNRAVDGDFVAIKILSKDEWISPSDIILEDESVTEGVDEVLEKEKVLKKTQKKANAQPTGMVVGIVRRKWRQYCGILQPSNMDGLFHLFVPADRKIPKVRIETRQAEFLRTQKIIVAIDTWPRHSRYPTGHFVRALGKIGDQATENEVVLLEHDVPHSKFSEEVLSFLPKLPWTIKEGDIAARVDLRGLDICSVDPPGCTDIDDALHCREIEDDKLEVGVHIADVSHFIRPGNALDIEASNRATTVYLVNNRIDMVPVLLSSNLCSLRGGEERFAFSCVWIMDKEANILETRFHKSIIKSKKAMTYEEAQMVIDDKHQVHSIAQSLRNLNSLAKILKRGRLDKGALVLASPEVKILMDSETHDPISVEAKKLFETNSMVEEFMLLANISVAQKILKEFPECALLRRHPTPPPNNFDPLVKAGNHLGFAIKIDSGKNLAASLDEAIREDNPFLNTMLRILATRCMMQAVYFSSGMYQKDEYFHYGLAVPLYTHFTSPIRRYADIIVHRLLAVAIGADCTYPDLLDKHKSTDLCKNLNYRNRMAQYAGRASVAFNTHLFFRGKLQDEEGYVLFVKKNALQILIPKYGLECTLYISEEGKTSPFTYDEDHQTQTAGDIVLHAFDPVIVRLTLDSKNIQHEKFILQLVKPHIEGFSIAPLTEMETKHKLTEIESGKKNKKQKKS
ncbi:PREDICTED: exosome complex exonuclease RRP44 [Nicrophorus vespilloides]|uniref:Exosome complex exonuclease RRP44 n=1 Tax=Nicrophorus vespilloides TaxID=110193 RepID=A0ABM1MSF2_NICVS|nr:PREDICTED: exosome complex exonuclease RRP44 [Nicrophorus vespilloides]